jgi:hypothetical protein
VFVLSPASLASRACQAELSYALALGRTILPVMVRDTNVQLAPPSIGLTHIVDYRQRNADSAIALLIAVTQAPAPGPLPDPLPEPPPPPITDLGLVRDRVAAPSLTFAEQQDLLAQLKARVDNDDERDAVTALLRQLRVRSDIAESVGREVDALVARLPLAGPVGDDADWSGPGSESVPHAVTGLSPEDVDLLRSLVTHIRSRHFTPILGVGLTDSLIGTRQVLARRWARSFEFPMARHQQEDLAHVAQFVTVMSDEATLRSSLGQHLREQVAAKYAGVDGADETPLGDVLRAAWDRQRMSTPTDPHLVLAQLPCPIYVTAHPATLLADALRVVGKDPVVEVCRWRPDVYDWPPSALAAEPGFVPDPQRPLVFHVFGSLDVPESLVLTEDDYFDFLTVVTEDRSLIPLAVRSALADSALLFLGFRLDDWDVRILLRSLVSQEGARRLQKYTHVAAQIDLSAEVISPGRARRYLEKYFNKFRKPSIDIFWGSVDEFTAGLASVWATA